MGHKTGAPWVLVANPTAGSGKGQKAAENAARALERAGHSIDLHFTRARGHAPELARAAVNDGAQRLILCGGDGTVREVLPVLAQTPTALGLLPFGTGNDLARALGIPRRIDAAVQVQLNGRPRALDLGKIGDHLFCTVAALGFDAEISHAMASGRIPISGTLGYLYAALKHLSTYRFPQVSLTGEFGVCQGKMLLVASGNTSSYGGGLQIAPHADPWDGKLDVCIVGAVSKSTVLRMLPRVFSGNHLRHPAVRVERTAWLKIETAEPRSVQADGEYLCETPVLIETQAASLQVIMPATGH